MFGLSIATIIALPIVFSAFKAHAQDPTSSGTLSPCFYPCDRQALVAANCASSTDWTCICTSATYQDTLRTCFEGCPQDKEAILGRQAQACGAAGLTVTNTGSASVAGSGSGAATSSVPTSTSVSVSTGPGLPSTSPTQTSGGVSGTSEGAGSPTTTSGATALNPSWLVMIGGITALMMEA